MAALSGDAGVFFQLLPLDVRTAVEKRLRVLRARRGRTMISAGSTSADVYFVAEGEVQVLLYSGAGREVVVRDLSPGDLFGELAALDGLPRSATVIASSDVRLLAMGRSDFLACIGASPAIGLWLGRRLGSEIRRLTERIFELSALNVQARLHCELLRMARRTDGSLVVSPAPTHAALASRIGTHREAVTREMRSLVKQNIIRTHRRALEFVDLDKLRSAVGHEVGGHPSE